MQAVSQDNVQPSAVMAVEALGSSMIVSEERINDGLDALNAKGRYSWLERIPIYLGLTSGGVATLIRTVALRAIPAFLLITSLKTFMTDEDIAHVLFEMLIHQGLARKPELRATKQQLCEVVDVVSGFCDNLVPTNVLDRVSSILRRANLSPSVLIKAYDKPDTKDLAEIYSRVFGSLTRPDEVDRISIHGGQGGAYIAASLCWLEEGDCQVVAPGISSSKNPRICVDFCDMESNDWIVRE